MSIKWADAVKADLWFSFLVWQFSICKNIITEVLLWQQVVPLFMVPFVYEENENVLMPVKGALVTPEVSYIKSDNIKNDKNIS